MESQQGKTSSNSRAQALIEETEKEVAGWLRAVDDEVEALAKAAQEAGQKLGSSKAEQLQEKLGTLEETLMKDKEAEIIHTALEVAKQLLNAEMAAAKDTIVLVAKAALSATSEASEIRLRAHPQDAATLKASKAELIGALGRASDLEIQEDRLVEKGGVLIQTESGVIDAQLTTQLEEIARALQGLSGAELK